MHANEYSHLRPTCRHTKWTRYPHSHSPYALYTPRSRHHHPQRGSQRPIPELNPLRSGVGTGDHPGPRSSRENQQPRPRPGGQLILTAPGPRQRTENRGVRKKKKKKKDPMLHPTRSNVVLVCVVLRCFKTGCFKTGEGHPPQACVSSSLPRALNVYVQLKIEKWALAPEGRLNEQTALRMPFSVPTPKALYVCVMWQ